MQVGSEEKDQLAYHTVVEQALIKAKVKEQKAEKNLMNAGYMFFVLLFIVIAYGIYSFIYTKQVEAYITHILSDQLLIFLLFLLAISFFYMKVKKDKLDKAEKDYEELLEDIIDRAPEIWPSSYKSKHINRLHELKDKHDINLFHK
ncbi:DUF2663 family protein [Evansella halocellulosilytica]|uniref:DUF2663 family protein n=1 Tax=Evansella halocellulosilytica TaxID=2011013 RepID=UPI0015CB7F93|nr:DUF2663 family protein [Evansella halocellulosilytica]